MRPFGDLIGHEEALARLMDACEAVAGREALPLLAARGRVAAEEVVARVDVPPFARATMDGYAIRAADAATTPARFEVIGAAHAGRPFAGRIGARQAVRIATGAPVPDGADAVVRVEDTRGDGDHVEINGPAEAGRSIDPVASDIAAGTPVARAGQVLTPAQLGLLASVGVGHVAVKARPRVRVHSTGDELLQPGEAPETGRIYDSNATTLAALLEGAGGDVVLGDPLPDVLDGLRAALRSAAADSELVVFSGGASVGERDLAVDALRAEGTVLFHGVRLKPGKPLLVGRVGRCLVVGLPGNPTSALSNAALFLVPALRRMQGLPDASPHVREARLASEVVNDGDRHLFLPVRLDDGAAHPTFKGSGALTSMADSDGWVSVPEGARLPAGAAVRVTLW